MKKIKIKDVVKLLPKRKKTSNKTRGGRALIIAGSRGLYGAGILAAEAAARIGAGYVILMTDLQKFSQLKNPDFLTADFKKQKINSQKFNAACLGPGLGKSVLSFKILSELLRLKPENVVLDADALNLLAIKKIKKLPSSWILTPHEGELARLLNVSATQIQKGRKKFVQQAADKYKCIVILKGYKTLIAEGKKIFEIQTGNVALAKAGTGDVLSGMITGLLAQGLKPIDAALLATTIHGKIADDWIKSKKDYLSFMARDLIGQLPQTLYQLRK